MMKTIRLLALLLSITSLGACQKEKPNDGCVDESRKNREMACYKFYDPVCGCNNVTYGNDCEARNAGVLRWTKGECGKPKDEKPEETPCYSSTLEALPRNNPCPAVYKPVCGCDGKTYGNDCEARNWGLLKWIEGECAPKKDECRGPKDSNVYAKNPCPAVARPVCGCDGKTYMNDCEAEREGILKWTEGECGKQPSGDGCFDPKVKEEYKAALCTADYDPVCGCDGQTYSNECTARSQGIVKYTKGACGTKK